MAQPAQTGSCPCCGRFIGPVRTCPYCSEDNAENRPVRALQLASLLLALVGLAFLYVAARCRELPKVDIAEITPVMNFARVRVTGTVTRPPYIVRDNGEVDYLSFSLSDNGGQITVAARRDVARALVDNGLVPDPGADVDVTGNIRVSGRGRTRLYLQSPDHILHGERKR